MPKFETAIKKSIPVLIVLLIIFYAFVQVGTLSMANYMVNTTYSIYSSANDGTLLDSGENQDSAANYSIQGKIDPNTLVWKRPPSYTLDVSTVYQYPELPNGCEITSATIVLNYLGYPVDKCFISDNYLPKTNYVYGANPEFAFMGNPRSVAGWYCFTAPIVTAVNRFLKSIGTSTMTALDVTGMSVDEIKNSIAKGTPVVFWGTVGFGSICRSYNLILADGNAAYANLHCMVAVGYTEDSIIIADPLNLTREVSEDWFTQIYAGMGSRAVIIVNMGETPQPV